MTEWRDLLARRRMSRSFSDAPLDPEVTERVLAAASRAPAAGNSAGTELLVLEGPQQTGRYWDITLPSAKRATFAWPGLLRAPLLIIPFGDPAAYVARYGEADKAATGLGRSAAAWPVPYWTVDTAFAAMLMQLEAIDAGLGVLFFGLFDHAEAVMAEFGVPDGLEPVGVLAVGHPDGEDAPGRSAARPVDRKVHRGRWQP